MYPLESASENFLLQSALILMSAAFEDDIVDNLDDDAVLNILSEGIDEDEISDEVIAEMEEFDADSFNLEEAIEMLLEEPEEHRFYLLQMVAMLRSENLEDIDISEDIFTAQLASGLELEAEFIDFYRTEREDAYDDDFDGFEGGEEEYNEEL